MENEFKLNDRMMSLRKFVMKNTLHQCGTRKIPDRFSFQKKKMVNINVQHTTLSKIKTDQRQAQNT